MRAAGTRNTLGPVLLQLEVQVNLGAKDTILCEGETPVLTLEKARGQE